MDLFKNPIGLTAIRYAPDKQKKQQLDCSEIKEEIQE